MLPGECFIGWRRPEESGRWVVVLRGEFSAECIKEDGTFFVICRMAAVAIGASGSDIVGFGAGFCVVRLGALDAFWRQTTFGLRMIETLTIVALWRGRRYEAFCSDGEGAEAL